MTHRHLVPKPSSALLATLALIGGIFACSQPARAQEGFKPEWQSSGIGKMVAGYRPHHAPLKSEAPEGLKRAPEGVAAPLYCVIELGRPDIAAKFILMVEAPGGKPGRLWVDRNANGDLTDDPPCTTTNVTRTFPDGNVADWWEAEGKVLIPFGSDKREGVMKFYSVRPRSADGKPLGQELGYYGDYGVVGEVTIEGRNIRAALQDAGGMGYFRLDQNLIKSPILWLGITNPVNRRFGYSVSAQRPFEVNGKWWAITNLTPEGAFQIVASTKPPTPVRKPDPTYAPGDKVPAFTAKRLDGKTVKFPEDYQGKVVLLDFWATWCGPCVAEIPNVVKAYEKFHDQGMEVLGISLDKENYEQKLNDFIQKKNMPWPQVYDGQYWGASVAVTYSIHAIPHMILVDGDTGRVIANETIRGEALAPAIEKALADKKK